MSFARYPVAKASYPAVIGAGMGNLSAPSSGGSLQRTFSGLAIHEELDRLAQRVLRLARS